MGAGTADRAVNTRLQPLNLIDFTGGLSLGRTDFQVAENESTGMLNMDMDKRGGFSTRPGWTNWNETNIVPDPVGTWRPRNAEAHLYSNGIHGVFITNANKIWGARSTAPITFVDLGAVATANPHLADMAGWGDTVYFGCGRANPVWRLSAPPQVGNLGAPLAKLATGNYNDNYAVANRGVAPACEHLEPHGGYMFAANIVENGTTYPSRIRWSHPDEPEDWATKDVIDIEQGGSAITGLCSFRDHLLIFKTDSVWALYGYDFDSWQLIRVSQSIGCPGPNALTRSESAVYFYSASGLKGIYGYQGETPILLSDQIKRAMDDMTSLTDVWLGWVNKRLWCQLPAQLESQDGSHGAVFIFDPELSNGVWSQYKPARGTIACIVERSDATGENPLVVTCGCTGIAGVMRVDHIRGRAADVFTTAEGPVGFRCRFRTAWQHAGWPELQKSWLRPRIIARGTPSATNVRVDTYWNYDASNPKRTHVYHVGAFGSPYWRLLGAADPNGNGFDWGDGTVWRASNRPSDVITRPVGPAPGLSLGWARAVQLEFAPEDHRLGLPWGVDAIVLKYNARRFTT